MLVNAGLAIKPLPCLTVAGDAHNIFNQNNQQATMHYGAEVSLIPGLLFRAGLDDGNKTAGVTLALGNMLIDYAYLGGAYNRTQMIGGAGGSNAGSAGPREASNLATAQEARSSRAKVLAAEAFCRDQTRAHRAGTSLPDLYRNLCVNCNLYKERNLF